MKLSSVVAILVLAALAAGGGLLAWRQHAELISLRASAIDPEELSALQKRIADLERANRELSDQLVAARLDTDEAEEDAAPEAMAPERVAAASVPADRSRSGRGNNPRDAAMRELMAKPEVQAALALQRNLGVELRYAALFKNLNLAPAQAEQLKAVLAERQVTLQDILLVAREQGVNPRTDPEGFRKLLDDAQSAVNANIKSVIGEAGFAQLQNYEQTLPQRSLVSDLQSRLSYTATPINSAQAEQLIQILAATTPQRGSGSNAALAGGVAGLRADANAIASAFTGANARGYNVPISAEAINQAQGILSEPQLNALKQLRQQQQAQQQLQQLMREAARGGRSGRSTGNAVGGNAGPRPAQPAGGG